LAQVRVKVLTLVQAGDRGRACRALRAGRLPTQTLAGSPSAQADAAMYGAPAEGSSGAVL